MQLWLTMRLRNRLLALWADRRPRPPVRTRSIPHRHTGLLNCKWCATVPVNVRGCALRPGPLSFADVRNTRCQNGPRRGRLPGLGMHKLLDRMRLATNCLRSRLMRVRERACLVVFITSLAATSVAWAQEDGPGSSSHPLARDVRIEVPVLPSPPPYARKRIDNVHPDSVGASIGRGLIDYYGCAVCHDLPGGRPVARQGPSLDTVGSKTNSAWLRRWRPIPPWLFRAVVCLGSYCPIRKLRLL